MIAWLFALSLLSCLVIVIVCVVLSPKLWKAVRECPSLFA